MKNMQPLSSMTKPLLERITEAELLSSMFSGQISATITIARENKGITQAQFAKLLGVKQAQVSQWENGGYDFSIKNLCKIASLLDMEFHCSLKEKT